MPESVDLRLLRPDVRPFRNIITFGLGQSNQARTAGRVNLNRL
jgi:hypothetical protein